MKFIILSGGSGERLWPISREMYPKSLLNLYGEKSLVQNIYELTNSVISPKNILTITSIRQTEDTLFQLKNIYSKPIIISEPMSKNTAPAVASALTFLNGKKDDVVFIFPVDFNIGKKEAFYSALKDAEYLAKQGYIVSIGVKPKYPEKGFGYIQIGEPLKKGYAVKKFMEKPQAEEINKYVKQKDYFWNSGIYAGKISTFLESYQKYAPEICKNFSKEMFDENNKIKYEYYENLPSISIDYALMEKIPNLAFVELKTKWQDYGSWEALYNVCEKDSKGNVIKGNVVADKIKNSFIYSSKELVAVSGIQNAVIVETEDALLVCDKSRVSQINKIVSELKKIKDDTVKIRKTVYRPWGFYTCLNEGKGWLTKVINVSIGHKLSLQSHNHRSEHWVILEGTATVILEDKKHVLNKGQSIDIPIGAKHSLQNLSKEPLKILEVQKGDIISEDDIIRYKDIYGRVK